MKNFIKYTFILTIFIGLFHSCEDKYTSTLELDKDVTIAEFTVNGVSGVINEKNKTIVVTMPDGTDVSEISPIVKIAEGAVITPSITSNMNFSEPIEFTLVNGDVFCKYTVNISEEFFIGFLGTAASASSIIDDDEKAAAAWFLQNYSNGKYISFDDIKSGKVDVSKFRVLWWYYDSGRNLPEIANDATVLNAITNFYKTGGNLLLNSHACAYLWTLGRMTDTYEMVIGDGEGGDNPDTWGIGVTIGAHDMSSHPIYKGVTLNLEGDGYKSVPVIGPGWKEDHNYVMVSIPANLGGLPNDDEAAYTAFTTKHNVKWLGVWAGIRDYWMGGVFEFSPTTDYKGKLLYLGIGGIEFSQNAKGERNPSGANAYQSNVNLLTKNSLDYLTIKN